MADDTAPFADEDLAGKLQQCDPVVQKYVDTLKAENLEFRCQLARREKMQVVAVLVAAVVGIFILISIGVLRFFSGLGIGGW